MTPSMIASRILIEATCISHRIGEGDIPDAVYSFLHKAITAALNEPPNSAKSDAAGSVIPETTTQRVSEHRGSHWND